ncbi:MAG TPA: hypothetical protein VMV83_05045 [Rectinemataceae bacterium]|nr:hypothetical protein [Rectinemataceae bacterium]
MKKLALFSSLILVGLFNLNALQTSFRDTVQIFRPSVVDFREDGIQGCFRGGVLINPSPAELKLGDVFIDVDGNAKKVAAVERVGSDLYVDTVAPRPEEVFLYVAIPDQTITFNEDNLLPNSLPANARVLGDPVDRALVTVTFEKEIYKKGSDNIVLGLEVSLDTSMEIGFSAPYYYPTDWWWWIPIAWGQQYGYIKGQLSCQLSAKGTLSTVISQGKWESSPISLYQFGSPIPGMQAGAGLYTRTIIEGNLNLQLPITVVVKANPGAQCTLAGMVPVMWPTDVRTLGDPPTFSVEVAPQLKAEASIKQKLYLGAVVNIVGIKITDFQAGGGPYFKLSGAIGVDVKYDTSTIPHVTVTPAAGETLIGSAELGAFFAITGSIYNDKWTLTILDKEWPFLTLDPVNGFTSPFI